MRKGDNFILYIMFGYARGVDSVGGIFCDVSFLNICLLIPLTRITGRGRTIRNASIPAYHPQNQLFPMATLPHSL